MSDLGEFLDDAALARKAAKEVHGDHGLGDPDTGPYEPDCACRATPQQDTCAFAGCGFCIAAKS